MYVFFLLYLPCTYSVLIFFPPSSIRRLSSVPAEPAGGIPTQKQSALEISRPVRISSQHYCVGTVRFDFFFLLSVLVTIAVACVFVFIFLYAHTIIRIKYLNGAACPGRSHRIASRPARSSRRRVGPKRAGR